MADTINETLEDLIGSIQSLIESQSGCCETGGSAVEQPPSVGPVSVGPGQQFETQSEYNDAKCNAANAIYDEILSRVSWLKDNDADVAAGIFGSVTGGLITGLLLAGGPLGWTAAAIETIVLALAGYLAAHAIEWADLEDALIDHHSEIVLSLFSAGSATTAEANFIVALEAATPTISAIESGLIGIMLTGDMLNQLFQPNNEITVYDSPDPIDCGGAVTQIWTLDASFESWTFRDDSTGSSSASREHDSGEGGIKCFLTVASEPNVTSWPVNVSPVLSTSIDVGGAIQIDYGPTSDAIAQNVFIKAVYGDASEDTVETGAVSLGGTLALNFSAAKTLVSIEASFARSTSGSASGSEHNTHLLEVRLYSGV